MSTFRERFQDLNQKLSNCRSELVMLHLEIGKQKRISGVESDHLREEEKRLILIEDKLEQELKNLSDDNDV